MSEIVDLEQVLLSDLREDAMKRFYSFLSRLRVGIGPDVDGDGVTEHGGFELEFRGRNPPTRVLRIDGRNEETGLELAGLIMLRRFPAELGEGDLQRADWSERWCVYLCVPYERVDTPVRGWLIGAGSQNWIYRIDAKNWEELVAWGPTLDEFPMDQEHPRLDAKWIEVRRE